MFTEVSRLQPLKASSPISATLLGIAAEVNPLQSLNAPSPIDVTPLGSVTDVKPLQPQNAYLPIPVTLYNMFPFWILEGMTTLPDTLFPGLGGRAHYFAS